MPNTTYFVSRLLINTARWLFLALLICMPWLFGGTRDWSITTLVVSLYTIAGLWVAGTLAQMWTTRTGLPEDISPVLLIQASLLALLGWSITLNAHSYFDPYLLQFVPVSGSNYWPGTVDELTSRTSMVRISALLLALLFSSHLASRPQWRRRLLVSVAATGTAIALFGVAQKIFQDPLLFWESDRFGSTNFAMYRYHANAAAFLNLAWPIGAALAFDAFRRPEAFVSRAIWLPGTIVMLVGVVVNVSKGGHLIAVLLLLLGTILAMTISNRRHRHREGKQWILPLSLAVVVAVGLAALVGPTGSYKRWNELVEDTTTQAGRVTMAKACLDMVHDRPWFGSGPGTFALVFPFYSLPYGKTLAGTWRYAHSDYLQTVVEWGVVGGLLWAGVFFGGMGQLSSRLLARWRQGSRDTRSRPRGSPSVESHQPHSPTSDGIIDAAVFVSLAGGMIHAVFDFPLQIGSLQLYAVALLGCAWRGGVRGER